MEAISRWKFHRGDWFGPEQLSNYRKIIFEAEGVCDCFVDPRAHNVVNDMWERLDLEVSGPSDATGHHVLDDTLSLVRIATSLVVVSYSRDLRGSQKFCRPRHPKSQELRRRR